MNIKKFGATFAAGSLLALGGLSVGAAGSYAQETNTGYSISSENSDIHSSQINDSQAKISSNKYEFYADGQYVKAKNLASGEVEDLPATATVANGKTVRLTYEIQDKNNLLVTSVSDSQSEIGATTYSAGSDAKCWGGVVSSGLLGAAAGAVGGPVGAVVVGTAGSFKGALDYCDI